MVDVLLISSEPDHFHLQDPGRYLAGMVPALQEKPPTTVLAAQAVSGAPLASVGVSVIVVPRTAAGNPASLLAVTVISPAASVAIDATYLLVCVDDSQPQLLTPGAVVPVWYTSDTAVRQVLAAKMISETFAFAV